MNIIDIARGYVGIEENTPQHKALIDEFNALLSQRVGYTMTYTDAWCAAFVSLCAYKAGADLPLGVGVIPMVAEAKKRGLWTMDAREAIGGYIVYDWDADAKGDHIGIVSAVAGEYVESIEGNTSDACKVKHNRLLNSYILGYIKSGNGLEIEPVNPGELPRLSFGAMSPAVKALQSLLILRGFSCGKWGIDGEIGNDTSAAIRSASWSLLHVDTQEATPELWLALINYGHM